jgi:hypothetical protein
MADICFVPENHAVYLALLAKADALTNDFQTKAKARLFRKAAETVTRWDGNILADYEEFGGIPNIPFLRLSLIQTFLCDFLEASLSPQT